MMLQLCILATTHCSYHYALLQGLIRVGCLGRPDQQLLFQFTDPSDQCRPAGKRYTLMAHVSFSYNTTRCDSKHDIICCNCCCCSTLPAPAQVQSIPLGFAFYTKKRRQNPFTMQLTASAHPPRSLDTAGCHNSHKAGADPAAAAAASAEQG